LIAASKQRNDEFQNLETSITGSARALYGDKVGASSFIYLLVVFTIVFGVIMTIPKIYDGAIATNILKAEFLLNSQQCLYLLLQGGRETRSATDSVKSDLVLLR